MTIKDKEKALLELAIELLQQKRKPQRMNIIIKEVMELKGYKQAQIKEKAPQFILDFMQSGYFVYCGDDCWDLKERQSTSILDKDGGDYEDIFYDDEDIKKNELKDDIYPEFIDKDNSSADDDDDDENDEEEDDLSREFEENDEEEGINEIVVELDEEEDDDENDDDDSYEEEEDE